MNSVRVNITLPPEVLSELLKSVEPRKRSRFIAESVVRSLKELKAKRLALEYDEAGAEIRRVNEDLDGTAKYRSLAPPLTPPARGGEIFL